MPSSRDSFRRNRVAPERTLLFYLENAGVQRVRNEALRFDLTPGLVRHLMSRHRPRNAFSTNVRSAWWLVASMLMKHPYENQRRGDEQPDLKAPRQSQEENDHGHQGDVCRDQKNVEVIGEKVVALFHRTNLPFVVRPTLAASRI